MCFQRTAASALGSMLGFLAAILLAASSSGENPAVQVTLSSKALRYGKDTAWLLTHVLGQAVGTTCDEVRCALRTRRARGRTVDHREAGGCFSSRHQGWNRHLVWYLILRADRVRADSWGLSRHRSRDPFSPALLTCSITVEDLQVPEPTVEFYQESRGLKTSASGLSGALTGGWMTTYGLMWAFPNLTHKKKKKTKTSIGALFQHINHITFKDLEVMLDDKILSHTVCFSVLQTRWWNVPLYNFWRGCELCGEAGQGTWRSSICHHCDLWGSRWRPGHAVPRWSQVCHEAW